MALAPWNWRRWPRPGVVGLDPVVVGLERRVAADGGGVGVAGTRGVGLDVERTAAVDVAALARQRGALAARDLRGLELRALCVGLALLQASAALRCAAIWLLRATWRVVRLAGLCRRLLALPRHLHDGAAGGGREAGGQQVRFKSGTHQFISIEKKAERCAKRSQGLGRADREAEPAQPADGLRVLGMDVVAELRERGFMRSTPARVSFRNNRAWRSTGDPVTSQGEPQPPRIELADRPTMAAISPSIR